MGGSGGVHWDLNQCILVCLVQTHMVTVGVHAEGYLNTQWYTSPCVIGGAGLLWMGGSGWLQGVLFVPGCLVTQPALLWCCLVTSLIAALYCLPS